MKQILVYGDSNTYGEAAFHTHRLPHEQRWTSMLEKLLNGNRPTKVIAEGLSGRVAGDFKQQDIHTNGLRHFEAIYRSHAPVEVLIIALGTNDSQPRYAQTAQDIFESLKQYAQVVKKVAQDVTTMTLPKLLYVVPLHSEVKNDYFVGANTVLDRLKELMKSSSAFYINPGAITLSADGVHFAPEGHEQLAKVVYEKVKELL
ncbi:MAG: GDSL-type esterase/lipase family protein [Candidatus Saccharimonadales bacterium]